MVRVRDPAPISIGLSSCPKAVVKLTTCSLFFRRPYLPEVGGTIILAPKVNDAKVVWNMSMLQCAVCGVSVMWA